MKLKKMIKIPVSLAMAFMLFAGVFTVPAMASQVNSQNSSSSSVASSESSKNSTEEVGFSVSARLPQNQINSNVSYFDLGMKPEDEQVLQVEVYNTSTEEITVSVEAITASTNRNGIIDYKTPGIKDESMKIAFSEIAVPKEDLLTIPANGSKTAQVEVTMPKEEYDGTILGGILLRKVQKEEEETPISSDVSFKEKPSGTVIENIYSYVIGVKLTETDVEIEPNFEIVSVEPSLVNARKAIANNIRNTQPLIIKGMDVSVKIRKEKSNEVLLENSMTNIDMAPNSVMPFSMLLNDVNLSPGKYVSSIHIELEDQEWDFDQPFEITADDASIWKDSVVENSAGIPVWAIILIIVGVLVLAALVFLIVLLLKKRSKGEESEQD